MSVLVIEGAFNIADLSVALVPFTNKNITYNAFIGEDVTHPVTPTIVQVSALEALEIHIYNVDEADHETITTLVSSFSLT